ncbi:phytanoyl-CoA dioxygenase family protein [Alloalcanivorax profundimaris]|uniref:phytanoyl-CoA dioxygenase family protein n=1 Tax=Alloalcanivorax profundimaris TaxID=2735259 RepID=UPI001890BC73|nr:phytanoyl-CoA dioxygenase family protein [Alloalcanivorax profundimaris]
MPACSPLISDTEVARYQEDGAVHLPGLFRDWVEPLRDAVRRNLEQPGPLGTRYGKSSHAGTFHGDRYMWTSDAGFHDYVLNGPGGAIAARLMGATRTRLFYDHLLVKEPGSEAPTPWHQDLPYWCVRGDQLCSLWVALDPVGPDGGMLRFVRGSHRWSTHFRAPDFQFKTDYASELAPLPDIDADPERYPVLTWEHVEPGDCIAFHAMAVHGASGNRHGKRRRRVISTRWMGDDVTYREHPNVTRPIRDPGLRDGDPMDSDLFPVVWPAAD